MGNFGLGSLVGGELLIATGAGLENAVTLVHALHPIDLASIVFFIASGGCTTLEYPRSEDLRIGLTKRRPPGVLVVLLGYERHRG